MLRFLVVFMLVQVTLFGVEILQPVQSAVILPWTGLLADVSGWLVSAFDPNVATSGKVVRSTLNGFAVSIEPGCNGVEAMIVLLAAIIAFPAPFLYKLQGLLWGFVAIQGVNLLRIISLFYLGQWNRELFDWAHLYVWQALIMLDALVVFLIWIRYLPVDDKPVPPASPQGEATV
ncbi:MAG TPA: exosortase H [Candidatus Thiothrix moscowensis]|uniref:exosortase H n=1 Tax=unclassified Thiothrix TaxID=2636184 RepID=UPI0025E8C265|nr:MULTISPECIES: exosortase H [unclassified Thiothrix]HRJ51651.1 exosortase H [Candidatus Thiothrix moscowensis]HRJ91966.1 exosortase H [Candidatus Thiothrix moscowensis]